MMKTIVTLACCAFIAASQRVTAAAGNRMVFNL